MGTHNDVDYLHGIVIPDERITAAGIAARPLTGVAAATTESDYTQGSAVPGIPESDHGSAMTLEATGTQTDKGHLEILTQRAGHPKIGEAGFVWRDIDAADSATEYKGHDGYQAVTGWTPIDYTTTDVLEPHMNVIRLESGKLLATGFVDSSDNYEVREYDPTTSTWAAGVHVGIQSTTELQSCLVELPHRYDGATVPRVILFIQTPDEYQIDSYYSDDEGATWARHGERICSQAILDSGGNVPTVLKMSADGGGDEICLCLYYDDASSARRVTQQWSSHTRGTTLDYVGNTNSLANSFASPTVTAIPAGGFVVSCWTAYPTTNGWYGYRTGSSADLFSSGTGVLITASNNITTETGTTWSDEGGTLWSLCTVDSSGSTRYDVNAAISVDAGLTWGVANLTAWGHIDQADYFAGFDAASTGGRAAFVTRWDATPTQSYDGNSVACVWLGGFADFTLPDSSADADEAFEAVNGLTWGSAVGLYSDGRLYLPIQTPTNSGWTNAGAGTTSLHSTGSANVSTAINQAESHYVQRASDQKKLGSLFTVRVQAGDGDDTTDRIALKLWLRSNVGGGRDVNVEVRFDDAGFRLHDPYAGGGAGADVGSPVALDMTTARTFFVAFEYTDSPAQGNVAIWYCTDSHVRDWTEGPSGSTTDNGSSALQNRVEFGHFATTSPADESFWYMVGASYSPEAWSTHPSYYSTYATGWANPECLNPRGLSALPALVFDGVKLAATSGPTRIGETWQIESDSDYPAAVVDPRLSSSPSRGWRSVDDSAQQILCWDLEPDYTNSGTWENDAIACFVFGANWESGFLEAYNSSAGWVTLGQLVASDGFTTLKFTRRGRILYPDTSQTTDGKRYFFREEHAGDTFDLGTAGDGGVRYHHIAHNAEGAWRGTGTTTKRPRLVLERDNLVATDPASGTGELWRRDFGLIVSGMEAAASYSHIRLRIPAQDTADGDLRIGTLVIGSVAVLARAYDWGWEYVHVQPISVTNRPDDSIAARTTGKMRREIRFNWATTGIDVAQVSESIPDPDYVAIGSTDVPAGVEHDTARNVEGIIRRAEQAACPVLLLTAIDHLDAGTSQKESRSRAMLLGRITTDPMTTAVQGDEGVDELERMQAVTMVEEV